MIGLVFVDYGNRQISERAAVGTLADSFLRMPTLGIRCCRMVDGEKSLRPPEEWMEPSRELTIQCTFHSFDEEKNLFHVLLTNPDRTKNITRKADSTFEPRTGGWNPWMFPRMDIPRGSTSKITLSHVDETAGILYVHKRENKDLLDSILGDCDRQRTEGITSEWSGGEVRCLAEWDGLWCRGEVIQDRGDGVFIVFFIGGLL